MRGQQVMASYVRSRSAEIGRFCDPPHIACFLAYEYVFHASLLVFIDVWHHMQLSQGHDRARSRIVGKIFWAFLGQFIICKCLLVSPFEPQDDFLEQNEWQIRAYASKYTKCYISYVNVIRIYFISLT